MIDEIKFNNEIMLKSLKELPRSGMYKAELAMIAPLDGNSEEKKTGVLMLEDAIGTMEGPELVIDDFEKNPQQMLLEMSRFFCDYGELPEIITYEGEDTRRLLSDYCEKTNIQFIPAEMGQALIDFFNKMGNEQVEDYSDWEEAADEYELSDEERLEVMIQALMMFTDEEIQNMDDDFKNEVKDLLTLGAFPPELVPEIRRKIGMDGGNT